MHAANAPSKMPPANLVEGGVYALLAIAGIVAIVAVPLAALRQVGCGGHEQSSSNQAYEIGMSVSLFELTHERYPTNAEGLAVLFAPSIAGMDALPKDSWGNDYAYAEPGVMNPTTFDVRSAGRDGVMFTHDDVGNWRRE